MVKELCNIEEVIKKKGYRLTDPRRAVFEAITERPEVYLSADDIHEFAKKKEKNIGLATVYRTLALLEEVGAVNRLEIKNEFSKYQLNSAADSQRWIHLVCTDCGKVIDTFPNERFDSFLDNLSKEYSFHAEDAGMCIYGLCRECAEKGEKNGAGEWKKRFSENIFSARKLTDGLIAADANAS